MLSRITHSPLNGRTVEPLPFESARAFGATSGSAQKYNYQRPLRPRDSAAPLRARETAYLNTSTSVSAASNDARSLGHSALRSDPSFVADVAEMQTHMQLGHVTQRCEELQRELVKTQTEVALKDELIKHHKMLPDQSGSRQAATDPFEIMRRLQSRLEVEEQQRARERSSEWVSVMHQLSEARSTARVLEDRLRLLVDEAPKHEAEASKLRGELARAVEQHEQERGEVEESKRALSFVHTKVLEREQLLVDQQSKAQHQIEALEEELARTRDAVIATEARVADSEDRAFAAHQRWARLPERTSAPLPHLPLDVVGPVQCRAMEVALRRRRGM